MDNTDCTELHMRLMAHQVLLCAALAAHPNKPQLSRFMADALSQMKSILLSSRLDDKALTTFDKEIHSILSKAGLDSESY